MIDDVNRWTGWSLFVLFGSKFCSPHFCGAIRCVDFQYTYYQNSQFWGTRTYEKTKRLQCPFWPILAVFMKLCGVQRSGWLNHLTKAKCCLLASFWHVNSPAIVISFRTISYVLVYLLRGTRFDTSGHRSLKVVLCYFYYAAILRTVNGESCHLVIRSLVILLILQDRSTACPHSHSTPVLEHQDDKTRPDKIRCAFLLWIVGRTMPSC